MCVLSGQGSQWAQRRRPRAERDAATQHRGGDAGGAAGYIPDEKHGVHRRVPRGAAARRVRGDEFLWFFCFLKIEFSLLFPLLEGLNAFNSRNSPIVESLIELFTLRSRRLGARDK